MTRQLEGQRFSAAGRDSECELLQAAHSVIPVLREEAENADRDSRLTPRATEALRAAGLFRIGVPRAYGGYEASVAASVKVTATVGLGCASSAWVLVITHAAQQLAVGYGPQVREELWSNGADFGMCGSFNPREMRSRKVDGGQIVSGRWPSASGAYQAGWAAVSIGIADEQGEVGDQGFALIPMTDLGIDDTWDMVGMRGTGSHTLVADSVFVPDHRIRGIGAVLAGPAEPVEPLYRIPLPALSLLFVGPMLGSTQATFDLVVATADAKPFAMSTYSRLADSPSVQATLADAANLIDTARMHLDRSATMLDAAAAAGEAPNPVQRARARMDAAHASSCLRSAMQLLLGVAGASGMAAASPIQRHWRDLETAARQPSINAGLCREIYGRALVGSDDQVSYMV